MSTESQSPTPLSMFGEIFSKGETHLQSALVKGTDYFIPWRRKTRTETIPFEEQGFGSLKYRMLTGQPITGACVIATELSRVQLRTFDLGDGTLTQIYIVRPQLVDVPKQPRIEIPAPFMSLEKIGTEVELLGVGTSAETVDLGDLSKRRRLLSANVAMDNELQVKGFEMLVDIGVNPDLPNSTDNFARNLLQMVSEGQLVRITRYDLSEDDFVPSHIDRLPI